MKWDFFYDEDETGHYKSIDDWYKDVRHLVWPVIITVILGIAIFVVAKYSHF